MVPPKAACKEEEEWEKEEFDHCDHTDTDPQTDLATEIRDQAFHLKAICVEYHICATPKTLPHKQRFR